VPACHWLHREPASAYIRNRPAKALFCGILATAAFGGTFLRPDEIEDLMDCMNRPKIAHVLKEEKEDDEKLICLGVSAV